MANTHTLALAQAHSAALTGDSASHLSLVALSTATLRIVHKEKSKRCEFRSKTQQTKDGSAAEDLFLRLNIFFSLDSIRPSFGRRRFSFLLRSGIKKKKYQNIIVSSVSAGRPTFSIFCAFWLSFEKWSQTPPTSLSTFWAHMTVSRVCADENITCVLAWHSWI